MPSIKFPDLKVKEEIVSNEQSPTYSCCQATMKESGLCEVSEKLEVVPKKYFIIRTKKVKFNCPTCYDAINTRPSVTNIVPTSNYGDSLIIDIGLSKYCDLIPVERYAQIAFQADLGAELPPQSLIGLTHHLANFLEIIYQKIKTEVQISKILLCEETPHKMLEGSETKNWYLCGFFSSVACYFEAHDTRSGDVAFEFLKESNTEFLLTDGYAGYGKAVKDVKNKLNISINEAHCNTRAYRYFKDASLN